MNSPQFSVRIPPDLDQRIKEYIATNGMTKSQLMVNALSHYLGCSSEIPLVVRMEQVEQRLAQLEAKANV